MKMHVGREQGAAAGSQDIRVALAHTGSLAYQTERWNPPPPSD